MNKGLGILDFTKTSSLGEILIFIEELKIYQERFDIKKVDVVVIQEKDTIPNFILPLLQQYLEIEEHWVVDSIDDLVGTEHRFIFPSKEQFSNEDFTFDSTKRVQDFFRERNYIPKLKSKKKEKVCEFLKEKSEGKIPIAVHLKHDLNNLNNSNANNAEWYEFFKYCSTLAVKFFIIGDDEIDGPTLSLPNVVSTRKCGLDIVDDLALIELASLFMGMCSGPFQIALFNDKPYVVFKNPDHHKKEMAEEIGVQNKYPFAAKKQKMLREFETKYILINELLEALHHEL